MWRGFGEYIQEVTKAVTRSCDGRAGVLVLLHIFSKSLLNIYIYTSYTKQMTQEEKKPVVPPVVAKRIQWPTSPVALQNMHARNNKFNNMGKGPGVRRVSRAAKGR